MPWKRRRRRFHKARHAMPAIFAVALWGLFIFAFALHAFFIFVYALFIAGLWPSPDGAATE